MQSAPLPDTQSFSALLATQHEIKDHPRDKHRREQVGKQTESERDRKPFHWSRSEDEQYERGDDRGYVSVDDRDPGMRESLVNGRGRRLPSSRVVSGLRPRWSRSLCRLRVRGVSLAFR